MSDAYGSYDNPYGVPPPYPNQPPSFPPPQVPAQLPPGVPPPPPPGPYQLPPGWAAPPREPKPGGVVAAAVLAFVLSGLTILVALLGMLGMVGAHVDSGTDPNDAVSAGDMVVGLVMLGCTLVASVAAVVLAGLALGRRQGARVTLVVLGFLYTVTLALIGVAMIVDGVRPATSTGEVIGGAIALAIGLVPTLSAVLLLLPSAGRWYASRPGARR